MGLILKIPRTDLIPFFSMEQVILKPKEKKIIKIEVQFIDKISGLADSKNDVTIKNNVQ